MIHIWLCDDEPIFLEHAAACLQRVFSDKQIDCETTAFTNAKSLLNALQTSSPDLILIDLVLKNEDGYQLADEICKQAVQAELVFITNYPERIADAFAYRPIGFMPKPIDTHSLCPIVDRFLFFYQQKHATYTVSTRSIEMHIPIADILYFESISHKILLHTSTQPDPILFSEKLDHIEQTLSPYHFIRCHKSFLVNAQSISFIDRKALQLHLCSGNIIPISRRQYTSIANQFVSAKVR